MNLKSAFSFTKDKKANPMKSVDSIYKSIKDNFSNNTNLDIARGSVIDSYTIAVSKGIEQAYKEIENNKNPHLYTNLKGNDIDSLGILVGCPRRPNEKDDSYLYRVINWNTSNQTGNALAIETALMNMNYVSNATNVPYTNGVGTSTVYIIPKKLDEETKKLAIEETKDRLKNIIGASNYVEYLIPKILTIDIVIYLSVYKDENNIKKNIEDKIESYINNIAPGKKLEVGVLNKIGNSEPNVDYFSVSSIFINDKEMQHLSMIQKLEEKFVFNSITWNMVVSD